MSIDIPCQRLEIQKFKKIDPSKLGETQRQVAERFSVNRCSVYETYIPTMVNGAQAYFTEGAETLDTLAKQLKILVTQLRERKDANRQMVKQVQQETLKAEAELRQSIFYDAQNSELINQSKSLPSQKREHALRVSIQEKKSMINKLNSERDASARQMDCLALSNIKIMQNTEQDNIIHEIFKWCLFFLYKDPIRNYYWKNFRCQQEAFINDKGFDFKLRCATVKAVGITKEECAKTEMILSIKEEILNEPLLTTPQCESIGHIFHIVQAIHHINHIVLEITALQKQLDSEVAENNKVNQVIQSAEKRVGFLRERMILQDQIFNTYDNLQKQIESKILSYTQQHHVNVLGSFQLPKVKEWLVNLGRFNLDEKSNDANRLPKIA